MVTEFGGADRKFQMFTWWDSLMLRKFRSQGEYSKVANISFPLYQYQQTQMIPCLHLTAWIQNISLKPNPLTYHRATEYLGLMLV